MPTQGIGTKRVGSGLGRRRRWDLGLGRLGPCGGRRLGLGLGTNWCPGGGRIIGGLLRHKVQRVMISRTTAPQGPLFGQSPKKRRVYLRCESFAIGAKC